MGRQFRPRSPEGMRADNRPRRTLRASSLGALLLLCACFALAIGGEPASLTVTNLTPHVLTVVVADQTFAAVAPGNHAIYRSSGPDTVGVTVSYRAGQGVEGSADRTFALEPFEPGTTSASSVYWSCSYASTTTSPSRGGPITWEVRPDTLVGR